MRLFAASVTAAALIAHALLGCCWHHAHAERVVELNDASATLTPVVHGGHVHDHEGNCSEPGERDHPHDGDQGCGEVDCTFAAGDARPQIQSPLVGLVLPVAAPAFSLAVGRLDSSETARTASGRQPPAPLYLLHQVLVI